MLKTDLAKGTRAATLEARKADALQATQAFLNYFEAAQKQIFERDYVIEPFQLAWIAKEHILMVGPPGNAKTALAKLLMQNVVEPVEVEVKTKTSRPAPAPQVNVKKQVVERPSFFSQQMTAETSLSDTHGPIDFKVLNETGRINRLYEEGILGARFAFIDEQFDMRPNGYRNILDVLAERAHSQGTRSHEGKTWTVVGASNTYLPEVYQKFEGSDQPRALIDRYSFVIYVPAEMEMASSNRAIVQGAKQAKEPLPRLTFEQIKKLQNMLSDVKIPDHVSDILAMVQYRLRPELESREAASVREQYEKVQAGEKAGPPWRATKHMSPRTLGKAAGILRAIVVLDWAQKGGHRELTATIDDIAGLKRFYALGGPPDKFVNSQLVRATKEAEQEQLRSIKLERKLFEETFETVRSEFNQAIANGLTP